jgi:hypothetical protein
MKEKWRSKIAYPFPGNVAHEKREPVIENSKALRICYLQ